MYKGALHALCGACNLGAATALSTTPGATLAVNVYFEIWDVANCQRGQALSRGSSSCGAPAIET